MYNSSNSTRVGMRYKVGDNFFSRVLIYPNTFIQGQYVYNNDNNNSDNNNNNNSDNNNNNNNSDNNNNNNSDNNNNNNSDNNNNNNIQLWPS
jgi:hypothetical protein